MPIAAKDVGKICSLPGCGKPLKSRGLCMGHYQAKRRAEKKAAAAATAPAPAEAVIQTRNSKYSGVDVEAGLLAVIMQGGVFKRAAELTGISAGTLKDWTRDHAERYHELRREKGPELERMAVDGLIGFVTAAEDAKHLALRKTVEQLESAEGVKDAGAVLRNIATAQGISVTKVMELTGRPTAQNYSGKSANELLASLSRLGAIINSTAVDLPPEPVMLDSGDQPEASQEDATVVERQ